MQPNPLELKMSAVITKFGQLLKAWRVSRGMTQQELAFRADLPTRHISFLETGRSNPSRDTVCAVSAALDIPFREINILFASAGLSALYNESGFDSESLQSVQQALQYMLDKHDPYPAWVTDGKANVVTLNEAALAFNRIIVSELPGFPAVDPMFHPNGLRRCITNWEALATSMLRRMQREILAGRKNLYETFKRVVSYPGVPMDWQHRLPASAIAPTINLELTLDGQELRFLTALTMFGSAVDPYVEELTIESCFPIDAVTTRFCNALQRS